jgi:hypothetical protein
MGTPTALRKTRAVLTGTSFADNTTGAITAQMIRQYVESDMGGYGCINHASADGTPVAQAIANGTTVTIDWSSGSSGSDVAQDTGTVSSTTVGADADFANDQIRLYDKGFYFVSCNLCIKQSATANIIWTAMLSTDNTGGSTTDSPALKGIQYITNANDVANFNISGIIDATGHTTYTDVYARIKHNNGSSQNMLLQYGQLSAVRIG